MATLRTIRLDDATSEQLEPYRTLRRRKDLVRSARFVAEGDKVVQRLLESDLLVESLLVTPAWLAEVAPLLSLRAEPIQVLLADDRAHLERATGFPCQGLKAVGRVAHEATLDAVLVAAARPWLFAAVDGVTNAENLGVLVRNAAALGVQAVLIGETSCSPFLTRAIRTSMGAVFRLPVLERTPLTEALERLRAVGVRLLATTPREGSRTLRDTSLTGDVCLVFGAEGDGVSPTVLRACDGTLAIPMARDVDSLNVASAAAVCFHEAWRQRSESHPTVGSPSPSPRR